MSIKIWDFRCHLLRPYGTFGKLLQFCGTYMQSLLLHRSVLRITLNINDFKLCLTYPHSKSRSHNHAACMLSCNIMQSFATRHVINICNQLRCVDWVYTVRSRMSVTSTLRLVVEIMADLVQGGIRLQLVWYRKNLILLLKLKLQFNINKLLKFYLRHKVDIFIQQTHTQYYFGL